MHNNIAPDLSIVLLSAHLYNINTFILKNVSNNPVNVSFWAGCLVPSFFWFRSILFAVAVTIALVAPLGSVDFCCANDISHGQEYSLVSFILSRNCYRNIHVEKEKRTFEEFGYFYRTRFRVIVAVFVVRRKCLCVHFVYEVFHMCRCTSASYPLLSLWKKSMNDGSVNHGNNLQKFHTQKRSWFEYRLKWKRSSPFVPSICDDTQIAGSRRHTGDYGINVRSVRCRPSHRKSLIN